jgi:hypothetical protein
MQNFITLVFNINKDEGQIVFKFVSLFLLLQAGLSIGVAAADSLFLLNVGVNKLPVIYILLPFVTLCYIPLYSYLSSKYGQKRIFEYIILSKVIAGVLFFVLLTLFKNTFAYHLFLYFFKMYTTFWCFVIYSILWNYTYNYFDILDGKRLFALFSGGGAIGAMTAGFAINLLTQFTSVTNLLLAWSLLALIAYPVLKWIINTEKEIDVVNVDENENTGFKDQILTIISTVQSSSFVVIVILVLFITQVLTNICEYQYMDIFSKNTSETELANLFGKLYIFINGFNFTVSLFLFNRMAIQFGVRNLAIFQPIIYSIAFTLLFMRYDFYAALFGFIAYQGCYISIDYDNTNLLLNALPSKTQEQTRLFIEGIAVPFATAFAGIFLLFANMLKPSNISLIGIFCALLYLVLVLILRDEYITAMISNLKNSWLDFSSNYKDILRKLSDKQIDDLKRIGASGKEKDALIAIRILWIENKAEALNAFMTFISSASYQARLSTLPIFSTMIKESDSKLFRDIIKWIGQDNLNIGTELIEEIVVNGIPQAKYFKLASSSKPDEIAIGAIALWNSWKSESKKEAINIIQSLAKGNDEHINAAITAMGRTKDELYASFIVQYLAHPNPIIRKTSLKAICRLITKNSIRLIPPILERIQNGDSDDRIMGMDAFAKIGSSNFISPLLLHAQYFTSYERRKAEQVIHSLGLKSVPFVIHIIRSRHYSYKGRSIAARVLSRIAFPQFELLSSEMIIPELINAYQFLYYYSTLAQETTTPGLEVLKKFYLDIHSTIVEYVLEQLTLGGKLPDYELVNASLHSKSAKERGNAIETIEQGVSRKIFKLILPLIDARPIEDRIKFYMDNFSVQNLNLEKIVVNSLESNIPIECTAAAQILWTKDQDKYQSILRKRMRNSDSSLFKKAILLLFSVKPKAKKMNIIERIYHLSNSKLFNTFGIQALEMISESATEQYFPSGQNIYKANDEANNLYCITSGEVKSSNNDLFKKGDLFGEDCLSVSRYKHDMISQDSSVLVISKDILIKNAEVYPRTALTIYEIFRKC